MCHPLKQWTAGTLACDWTGTPISAESGVLLQDFRVAEVMDGQVIGGEKTPVAVDNIEQLKTIPESLYPFGGRSRSFRLAAATPLVSLSSLSEPAGTGLSV